MQCRIDKRVIELLNEQGVEITWEQFRTAYDRRRSERASSIPKAVNTSGSHAEAIPFGAYLPTDPGPC